MTRPAVDIQPSLTALIDRATALILADIHTCLRERPHYTLALSGGSTPKPLYQALAQQDLPWERIHCFWGDERYVPADHPDSNEGMARHLWLNQVSIPPENIHPMPTRSGDAAVDAALYDQALRDFFQAPAPEIPQLDLILLGLGDDGHTASLFPETPALDVHDRLVTVGDKDGQPRITFTVPLINRARSVLFLVAGSNKQAALSQIFLEDPADPRQLDRHYPARLVRPQGHLLWLLDGAAGANLIQA